MDLVTLAAPLVSIFLKTINDSFRQADMKNTPVENVHETYQHLLGAIRGNDYHAIELYSQQLYPEIKSNRFTGMTIKGIFEINKNGLMNTNELINASKYLNITPTNIEPKKGFPGGLQSTIDGCVFAIAGYLSISFIPLIAILMDAKEFVALEDSPYKTTYLLVSFIAPILGYLFGVRPMEKVLNNALTAKRLCKNWLEQQNAKQ